MIGDRMICTTGQKISLQFHVARRAALRGVRRNATCAKLAERCIAPAAANAVQDAERKGAGARSTGGGAGVAWTVHHLL